LLAAGFVAVVPDFYKGQSAPSDMSKIMDFLGGFPVEKVRRPRPSAVLLSGSGAIL
jgi:hypothetical protein